MHASRAREEQQPCEPTFRLYNDLMRIRPIYFVYGLSIAMLVVFGLLGFGAYKYRALSAAHQELVGAYLGSQKTAGERFVALEEKVGIAVSENAELSASLQEQSEKNQELEDELENKLEDIGDTVGDLEKLSKTDPELLQKYSKVFFLNEHFAPSRLVQIPADNVYNENRVERVSADIWPYLKSLLAAADKAGIKLYVKSAFRSFEEQRNTKSAYSVTYGAGTANTFSADQGYSEHQLGTAVDFITTGLNGQLDGFETTVAYTWLLSNAHKYGFVISYPQGNQYYIFEPWHWRFVGVDLASDLKRKNQNFYDMDQRDIDEYLIKLYD